MNTRSAILIVIAVSTLIAGCDTRPLGPKVTIFMDEHDVATAFSENEIDRNPVFYSCVKVRFAHSSTSEVQCRLSNEENILMVWWKNFVFQEKPKVQVGNDQIYILPIPTAPKAQPKGILI